MIICPIRFDCTSLMYREIKTLYSNGDNLYKVYYSVATMEWVFGNGERISEYKLEDYINKKFSMSYIEDALDWFAKVAKTNQLPKAKD